MTASDTALRGRTRFREIVVGKKAHWCGRWLPIGHDMHGAFGTMAAQNHFRLYPLAEADAAVAVLP
jgi:hypothetical protein